MGGIPFTLYDILAYLSSGSIILVVIDYLFNAHYIFSNDLNLQEGIAFLFLSYITGHIVAFFASLILEDIVANRWIGSPSSILMNKIKHPKLQKIFPGYLRPLPIETKERIISNAKSRLFFGEGEALFLHAFSIVTASENFQKRLDDFRNQYGFARNISFSLLIASCLMLFSNSSTQEKNMIPIIIACLFICIGMFLRYLKFYRQYTFQLFVTYSEMPVNKEAK